MKIPKSITVDRIEKDWKGCTVAIIGGGPSLKNFDFTSLSNYKTIGVNASALLCGTDVLFSLDQNWIRSNKKSINSFPGEKYLGVISSFKFEDYINCKFVLRSRGPSLSKCPQIVFGENSGQGAINLCLLKGVSKIFLFGFDMEKTESEHWHSEYVRRVRYKDGKYDRWIRHLQSCCTMLDNYGINVINVNNNNRLPFFKTISFSEFQDRYV